MRVVTCCHHSASEVVAMMRHWRPALVVKVLDAEALQSKPDVLICSASTLNSAKQKLGIRKSGIALVMDTPAQCAQIKNAIHLDLLEQKPTFRARFKDLTQDKLNRVMDRCLNTHRKVRIEKVDPVDSLMDQQLGSILNPISSFLYTVRDPEEREKFKRTIFGWLISERKPTWLVNKVMRMGGYNRIPKALTGLVETVEQGDGPRKAFRLMVAARQEGKPVNYRKLSKTYKVSTFDMRYTMSVITSLRLIR